MDRGWGLYARATGDRFYDSDSVHSNAFVWEGGLDMGWVRWKDRFYDSDFVQSNAFMWEGWPDIAMVPTLLVHYHAVASFQVASLPPVEGGSRLLPCHTSGPAP